MNYREKIRGWLIQEAVGLFSKNELVNMIDGEISAIEDPPYYLLKISFGESLAGEDLLDLVMYPVVESDCKTVARSMMDKYRSKKIDMYQLAEVSKKMYLSLEWGSCKAFDLFMWISDEVDLIEQGAKDKEQFNINAYSVMENIVAL